MRKTTLIIIAILIIAGLSIRQLQYNKRSVSKTLLIKASPESSLNLPSESLLLVHEITYTPNSSHFEHTLSDSSSWLSGWNYRRPITINEQSGNTLTNYSVLIEYDFSTLISEGKINSDLSDLRFTDEGGNLLPYFIFSRIDNLTKIYVKIPDIPASGNTTIYMYYGNPSTTSPGYSPDEVVIWYDDFEDGVVRSEYVSFHVTSVTESNGYLTIEENTGSAPGGIYIKSARTYLDEASPPTNVWILIETQARQRETTGANSHFGIHIYYQDNDNRVSVKLIDYDNSPLYKMGIYEWSAGGCSYKESAINDIGSGWYLIKAIIFFNGTIKGSMSGEGQELTLTKSGLSITKGYLGLMTGWSTTEKFDFNYVLVRQYIDPEPSYTIGLEQLPPTTGYQVSHPDPYGWRVYTNGSCAELVSEVNITLPYTQVLVKNITFYARTNGTGNYRRLWTKVLDESGALISEISNATVNTTWTIVTINISANMSNLLTLWINATVNAPSGITEEIGIKDVKIYVEYKAKPSFEVLLEPNVSHFNCSSLHYVDLGTSEYLKMSTITFKLIDYLTLNTVDYPTSPTYIGNETINTHNYKVYKIDPANYSQNLRIYALLENKLTSFDIKIKDVPVTTALIGEVLTITLPLEGNITIEGIGEWTNTTKISFKPENTGTFTIRANITKISEWRIGYAKRTIEVKYGEFAVKLTDLDSKIIDYEDITLLLINKTSGEIVKELKGRELLNLTTLRAYNYTLRFKFEDIVLEVRDFTLNITTDKTLLNVTCPIREIPTDYRGFNRSLIVNNEFSIISFEDLYSKYPFSRKRIIIDGSGTFKLYIDYVSPPIPDRVAVESNVTDLKYYWNRNYLVLTGTLSSIGEVNITDLYELKLTVVDRLKRYLPVELYINTTKFKGYNISKLFPVDDYIIKIPLKWNGFEFYSYTDGYNRTERSITMNQSRSFIIEYRVPTKINIAFVKTEERKEYVIGYFKVELLDYYTEPVSYRNVTLAIKGTKGTYKKFFVEKTDFYGIFTTPIVRLYRGEIYTVNGTFEGDDIYVGSTAQLEVQLEEMFEEEIGEISLWSLYKYWICGIIAILIILGVIILKRGKKIIIEERRYKYVEDEY